MKLRQYILFSLAIIFALSLTLSCSSADSSSSKDKKAADVVKTTNVAGNKTAETNNPSRLPKMLDLGSKSCIPCKAMAPILDSLREEYKGRAEISFIDVRENRAASLEHKITLIPTQIFFDSLGVEKFRHVGFYPADSIVTHLRALGVM